MDPECVALCEALNCLPGIKTTQSCCGHGKQPYRVWFRVTDFHARGLLTVARLTCPRYYAGDWEVKLSHGDVRGSMIDFLLEGAVGTERYAYADKLAHDIVAHVENKVGGFNILLDNGSLT